MGLFYKYVADSMVTDFNIPQAGKLTPYTALVIFAIGVVISSFVFNTFQMKRPFAGAPLSFNTYFKGKFKDNFKELGELELKNGDIYSGQFREVYQHGSGKLTTGEGEVF